jgi:hypothetical protein
MAKIPQQLRPLILLFGLMIAGLITARYLLVPESFGDYGHYRADAVTEIAELPNAYAGYQACAECHSDIIDKRAGSHHRGLACETCHGPAAAHAEAPDEVTPPAPRDRTFCPVCHGYNASRPSGFPQVIATRHNPGKPCMSCHDPHAPTTPEAVKECGACHRDIVNQKSVSAHTDLPCSQCHEVPAEHFTQPRVMLAHKPTENAVCGVCHDASGSAAPGTPTVEIQIHSGRYRCWDCHYPHFPEAEI